MNLHRIEREDKHTVRLKMYENERADRYKPALTLWLADNVALRLDHSGDLTEIVIGGAYAEDGSEPLPSFAEFPDELNTRAEPLDLTTPEGRAALKLLRDSTTASSKIPAGQGSWARSAGSSSEDEKARRDARIRRGAVADFSSWLREKKGRAFMPFEWEREYAEETFGVELRRRDGG